MADYIIITIFYFLNVVTFFMFARDKRQAILNMRRIPEFWLLSLSAIGGSLGASMGMLMFRHKTLHKRFRVLIPIFLVIHSIILFILGYIVDILPNINI